MAEREPERVHVVLALGQSNMSGRGVVDADEGPAARVWQFPAGGAGGIVAAREPLGMPDHAAGMGPALQFSSLMRDAWGSRDAILIVPAAYGGTRLSTDESPLGWRWGVPGNLAEQAVQQTSAAQGAAAECWPDAVVRIAAILWLQGESDGRDGVPPDIYGWDLTAFVEGLRHALGDPTTPFLIAQMCPDGLGTGTSAAIDAVQASMPSRLPRTRYAASPGAMHNGDGVHFSTAAQQTIGRRLFAEYRRMQTSRVDQSIVLGSSQGQECGSCRS